jgi:hypothetical protein
VRSRSRRNGERRKRFGIENKHYRSDAQNDPGGRSAARFPPGPGTITVAPGAQ